MQTTVSIQSDPLDGMSAILMFLAQAEAKHDFAYFAVSVQPYHSDPNCDGDCDAITSDVLFTCTITGPVRTPQPTEPLNQGAYE